MSKKALANAERIADEAIHMLDRLNEAYKDLAGCLPPQTTVQDLADHTDKQVRRLRAELEGQG